MAENNTSNNSTTSLVSYSQIAKIDIPQEVSERWELIPAGQFNQERAVLCYGLTVGAWQQIKPTTFADCFDLKTPTLGGVAFYSGDDSAVQMLAEMITTASLILNVGKNIRAEQIYATASMILQNPEYKLFTVADLRLVMNRGVMGKYGQIFDRFDVNVISGWMNQYWIERQDEAERISIEKHAMIKAQPQSSEGVKIPEWFSDFVRHFNEKNANEHIEVKPNDFVPDDLIVATWKSDWLQLPEPRPKFESYCQLKKIQLLK